MKVRKTDPAVYVTDESLVRVDRSLLDTLRSEAPASPRKRIRFRAHVSDDDTVQEMIIALARETYIAPHTHLGKSESFHIIEGAVDVVFFDDAGEIVEVVRMGDSNSGRVFFYRQNRPGYHAVVPQSAVVIFHETANGPFRKGDSIAAPWAPAQEGAEADRYMADLRKRLAARERS
jgi:cupin fold WbuC family metalloprotein